MMYRKILPVLCVALLVICLAHLAGANPSMPGSWVYLSSDAPDNVRSVISAEVNRISGYATIEESHAANRALMDEKEREDNISKATLAELEKRFKQFKRVRDTVSSSFSDKSSEYEDSRKNLLEVTTAIQNHNSKISLCEKEIVTQQDMLKKYLKTEKQGEALAAVIHTQGIRDTLNDLNRRADELSAPELVNYMGSTIQSYTEVVGGILTMDFIRSITEGTAKPVNEEPVRIQLDVTNKGTQFLRVKRYELYLFQEAGEGRRTNREVSEKNNVVIIFTLTDLERLLSQHGYQIAKYDTSRIRKLIEEVTQINRQQNEALKETVTAIQERITYQRAKISEAKADRERDLLKKARIEEKTGRLESELSVLKGRKQNAEADLAVAQSQLNEKKRISETIILKFALQASRGTQSPADASIEAIIDKLEEVKNEARVQHSRETVEVTNAQLSAYEQEQASTEARVTAVRLIALTNEGSNGVRVRVAFRVRTVMAENGQKQPPERITKHPPPTRQEQKRTTAPDKKQRPTKARKKREPQPPPPDRIAMVEPPEQPPEETPPPPADDVMERETVERRPTREISLKLVKTLSQHRNEILSLAFSDDGAKAASGDRDNTVMVWNTHSWSPTATLKGHRNNVQALAFSPRGRYLASGSSDDTVIIWDPPRSKSHLSIKVGKSVNALDYSPNGSHLAVGVSSKDVTIWNASNGSKTHTFKAENDVLALAYSPDGRTLATAGKRKTVQLWSGSGKGEGRILEGHRDDVRALAFTRGGRQLITGGEDQKIIIWNVTSGAVVKQLEGHDGKIVDLAVNRDGSLLVSADDRRKGTIIIWDLRNGAMLKRYELDNRIKRLAMSPNGRNILVANDKVLQVYRLE